MGGAAEVRGLGVARGRVPPTPSSGPTPLLIFLRLLITGMSPPEGCLPGEGYKFPSSFPADPVPPSSLSISHDPLATQALTS